MNFSLSKELEKFVREGVASQRYTSASELVREALRLLQETDKANQPKEALSQIRLRQLKLKVAKAPIPSELKFTKARKKKGKTVSH